jgi:hypothetical protein
VHVFSKRTISSFLRIKWKFCMSAICKFCYRQNLKIRTWQAALCNLITMTDWRLCRRINLKGDRFPNYVHSYKELQHSCSGQSDVDRNGEYVFICKHLKNLKLSLCFPKHHAIKNYCGWATGWIIGGLSPGRGWEFFSSPPRPDRLWGPPSLLGNSYQGLLPWE